MPLPRGVDPDKAAIGYIGALQGFTVKEVTSGIRKFLRGECDGISTKFCPHPPELASIVRGFVPRVQSTGGTYSYKPPKSAILERNCTKDWAAQLVRQGVHPRGSIWCPGPYGEDARFGDLFAPDEGWQSAKPIDEVAA